MIVGITGSGGKTSLMFLFAEELSKIGKVLVTTTTKIFEPNVDQYENFMLTDSNKILKGNNLNIDIIGLKIENGKLLSPDENVVLKLKSEYDYILYEGDGSKRKMMKFWNENEPCIIKGTSIIIGVGNIKITGKDFNEENVHRYNMYINNNNYKKYKIENLKKTENKIKIDDNILTHYLKNGKFFGNSFDGKKIIFFNGVEEKNEIIRCVKSYSEIDNFTFGSVMEKKLYIPKKISAVIMCSGEGKRFGKNKLLEKIDGIPMVEILFKKMKSFPFDKVYAVYKDNEILDIINKYDIIPLKNDKYFLGQSESIKKGVENIKNGAIMFFTGDMPFLKEDTVMEIIAGFYENGDITVPRINNHNSSPVIFPERYRDELLNLNGDAGGRSIVKKSKCVKYIDFSDEKEFMDIDTKEDLNILEGGK